MTQVVAILQARVSSSRLPGKVLKPLLGRPMLLRQIERLRRCRSFEKLVVATSTDPTDDALAALCATEGIACHRGSLDDVLSRFFDAAQPLEPGHVVRLTGDCPLTDPQVIDRVVALHLERGVDYTSNFLPPTWPDGIDAEIVRWSALVAAHSEARLPSQREHVTLFINRQPERFSQANLVHRPDLSSLRWTVDEPADFAMVEAVYQALYPAHPEFGLDEVLALLAQRPDIAALNGGLVRNEGLLKSLAADAKFLERH